MKDVFEFRRGVTKHGLEVFVRQVPSRQVACGLVVFGGMRGDPIHQPGLSHALEHALVTQDGPFGDFISKERIAHRHRCAPFGMGSTAPELTYWKIRGLASTLPLMFRWLAAMTRRPPRAFSLDRLTAILHREYIEKRNPQDLALRERVWGPLIPAHHPLLTPERPEFISRLSRRVIEEHWERNYGLRNMALVVAGDTTLGDACAVAERAFPGMPHDANVERVAVAPIAASPVICGELHLSASAVFGGGACDDGNLTVELCRVIPPDAESYEAAMIAMQVLSSVAFSELRERRGLAYSVDVSMAAFRDLWTCEVGVKFAAERYDAVMRIFRQLPELVARVGNAAFTDAKRRLATQIALREETMEGIIDDAVEELTSFGALKPRKTVEAAIRGVSFADVNHGLKALLAQNQILTVVVYP